MYENRVDIVGNRANISRDAQLAHKLSINLIFVSVFCSIKVFLTLDVMQS